jgi:hypothetical protein
VPLSSRDWEELLEFLRNRARASGYSRLDEAAIVAASSADFAQERVVRYLAQLVSSLSSESGGAAREAEIRLERVLTLAKPFGGFEVELSPYERARRGRASLPLRELSDMDPLVSRLRALIHEFEHEPPLTPPAQGFAG